MEKYATLDTPDNMYDWLVDFFSGHSHCTRYCDQTSALQAVSASIVQVSAVSPVSYVVTAADLVIFPHRMSTLKVAELDNMLAWSMPTIWIEPIQLNWDCVCRQMAQTEVQPPTCSPRNWACHIAKDTTHHVHLQTTVDGWTVNTCKPQSVSPLYVLRVLRAHAMPENALKTVYQATVMTK